ncbi:MAG: hypothetical protein JRE61_10275 [Deltaproteobacteria bacterium]|nr:hypothetical protein [Deltaproteobacteria bacterium]
MKRLRLILFAVLVLGLTVPALGAEFTFHGDFNNRFMVYTDQSGLFAGAGEQSLADSRLIKKGGASDSWGEIKYRLWLDAATNDGNVRGVYAIELGALDFGKPPSDTGAGPSQGGSFSGDKVNIETRWAYTDFQLPGVDSKARFRIGLQPMDINYYLWKENVMGVNFYAAPGSIEYQLAWVRGYEVRSTATASPEDVDGLLGRVNFKPTDGLKIGLFALFNKSNADTPGGPPALPNITGSNYQLKRFAKDVPFKKWDFGIDGGYETSAGAGKFYTIWDLIYQTGDLDDVTFEDADGTLHSNADVDLQAYFAKVEFGYAWKKMNLNYKIWYASGDDNSADSDFDGYVSTDVDSFDGIVLFESYTDDNYFTERHYLLDKGFIMNKLSLDYKVNGKLKVGVAALYMLTAEDIKYTAAANGQSVSVNDVGLEFDGYISYMLYKNVELAINAGYLLAGDAMDYWEEDSIQNGSSDENIFKSGARVRYKF